MHCLGVVAGVEQAVSLQQHRQACLEEAGREEESGPLTVGHLHRGLEVRQGSGGCLERSGLTLELQGKSFFQGVRFSVQTTSRGSTA